MAAKAEEKLKAINRAYETLLAYAPPQEGRPQPPSAPSHDRASDAPPRARPSTGSEPPSRGSALRGLETTLGRDVLLLGAGLALFVVVLTNVLVTGLGDLRRTNGGPRRPGIDLDPPRGGPTATLRVTEMELGRAIGPDKRVTDVTDSFRPTDAVYAVVTTEGTSRGTVLTAHWNYQDGRTVTATTQTIAPTGPAMTEFRASKPAGWPKGTYTVVILVDGVPKRGRQFKVD